MAINIQNIIDQITTKAAAADSSMNTDYLLSLSKATLAMNNATGVIEYRAKSDLPTVDSSILGNFAYIAAGADLDSVYGDSYGAFFYAARIGSNDSGWDRIRTGADSDAEASGVGVAGYTFQGSVSGYTSLGYPGPYNIIDKFPFSTDANATDVGDMTSARQAVAGHSSVDHGYASGGLPPTNPSLNTIDKFPFAVDENGTDVGDLATNSGRGAGVSSETFGYTAGGYNTPPNNAPGIDTIQKFSFTTDGNSTNVGNLAQQRKEGAGHSSTDNGYVSGGRSSPGTLNNIDKWSFASDGTATDVGNLTSVVYDAAGQSSADNGYSSGGDYPVKNVIQKFPFSTDANASDVGDLTIARIQQPGQSSTDNGYTSGGRTLPITNVIDKFPFSTDANATDVGDLSVARGMSAGHQV